MSAPSRITSDLDPFAPEFRTDPFRHYATLRRLGRVVWLERHSIWAVAHHEEVRTVLSEWQRFSNAGGGGLANYFETPPWRPPSIILEVDPPLHERARGVLMRVLSPGAIRAMRPAFVAAAERLIDRAIALGSIDAVPSLVQPFPLTVFPDQVGLAAEGREMLLAYGTMVFGAFGPVTPWYEALMREAGPVIDWITTHCRRTALAPAGLGAAIYAAADAGTITEDEATLLVRSLLSAGVDTTIDAIGLALRLFAEHPDQWRLLRADPGRARAAFEEATRFDSSSQSLFRTTLAETELSGTSLGRHQKVICFIGSAGRDPERWDEPDRFDITRRITGQMSYGTGIHGCVAQTMARLEGEVFFETLARKVARIEPTGPSVLRTHPGLRGLASLPIRLIPADA